MKSWQIGFLGTFCRKIPDNEKLNRWGLAQTDFLFQRIETLSTLFSLLSLHLIVGNRNNYEGKIKVDKEHQDHETV